ncbi:MAG TPA: hypothetical protein VOB72_12810 [Candidatus Dormibacteraeota bacterium]|nr:hypothetical protein [Candidatus Dormibacteraeota bacterium]
MIGHAPSDARPVWTSAAPRLLAGLGLLGVAMTGTAVVAPGLARAGGGDQPDYAAIAGTGLVMILLSSLFLAYAGRVVGLGLAWLGLAAVTNALVLAGKFVLVPYGFYQTTFVQGDLLMNVTSSDYFPVLGGALFVVYATALGVLYAWQHNWVDRQLAGDARAPGRREGLVVALTIALALTPIVAIAGLWLLGYGLFLATATGGVAVLLGLAAAVAGAATMARAGGDSVSVRSTAVITSAFWLVLSLLLVYHVVWVVFMTVLVGIWPLKVVAPSGK